MAEPTTIHAEIVEAQQIRLVDDDGNLRAALGLGAHGQVRFLMLDKQERPRQVRVNADGDPQVALLDENGEVRAQGLAGEDSSCWSESDRNGTLTGSVLQEVVPGPDVSKPLGHASAAITLSVYPHAMPREKRDRMRVDLDAIV